MTAKEYAFIKSNDVVNIAVFDEPTEELLEVFKQEHNLDDIILSDGEAFVGFTWNGSKFIPPKPYTSWAWNEEENEWEAPIPMPEDGKAYEWDELTNSWKELVVEKTAKPFESWVWNDSTSSWQAPISYPSDGFKYRWNEEGQAWVLVPSTEAWQPN